MNQVYLTLLSVCSRLHLVSMEACEHFFGPTVCTAPREMTPWRTHYKYSTVSEFRNISGGWNPWIWLVKPVIWPNYVTFLRVFITWFPTNINNLEIIIVAFLRFEQRVVDLATRTPTIKGACCINNVLKIVQEKIEYLPILPHLKSRDSRIPHMGFCLRIPTQYLV